MSDAVQCIAVTLSVADAVDIALYVGSSATGGALLGSALYHLFMQLVPERMELAAARAARRKGLAWRQMLRSRAAAARAAGKS